MRTKKESTNEPTPKITHAEVSPHMLTGVELEMIMRFRRELCDRLENVTDAVPVVARYFQDIERQLMDNREKSQIGADRG